MVIARVLLVSLLVVSATSCSTFSNASLSGSPGAHRGVEERRAWSAQPLAWGDFRGVEPALSGSADAATVYAVTWMVRCSAAGFESDAIAHFFPRRSWVKTSVLLDSHSSGQLLRHERLHFDVGEVYARTMRRYFMTAYRPCDRGGVDVQARAWEFEKGSLAVQSQYDEETDNGRNPLAQGRWEDLVRRTIAMLEPFSSQVETRYFIHGTQR